MDKRGKLHVIHETQIKIVNFRVVITVVGLCLDCAALVMAPLFIGQESLRLEGLPQHLQLGQSDGRIEETAVVHLEVDGDLFPILHLDQLNPRLAEKSFHHQLPVGVDAQLIAAIFERRVTKGINDGGQMRGDAYPILQLLAGSQPFVDVAREPTLQKRHHDGAIVSRAERVAMTKDAGEDPVPSIHFGTKDAVKRDEALVDKNSHHFHPELFFFVVVTLDILDRELDSLDDEVIAVSFYFAIQQVLLLANDGEKALLFLPFFKVGYAAFEDT